MEIGASQGSDWTGGGRRELACELANYHPPGSRPRPRQGNMHAPLRAGALREYRGGGTESMASCWRVESEREGCGAVEEMQCPYLQGPQDGLVALTTVGKIDSKMDLRHG